MKRCSLPLISVVLFIAACGVQTEDTRCDDLKDRVAACGLGSVPDSATCSASLLARYDQVMEGDCTVLGSGKADTTPPCNEPCYLPDARTGQFCLLNESLEEKEAVRCCKSDVDFYQERTAECDALGAAPDETDDPESVCGDGVREEAEQCDDGNTANLDGCDAACRFEQTHRVNYLQVQYDTDSFCASNAFGTAFPKQFIRSMFQSVIDDSIEDGTGTMLFKLLELDDLTGTDDPAVVMGWMSGTPVQAAGYDGTNDLDWWYDVDTNAIDAQRDPLAQVDGSITSGLLAAGPGNLTIGLNFGGTMADLDLSNAMVEVTLGASSTPLTSSGDTPGHLPGENLDPALQSFASAGEKNDTNAGKICSNISAHSLAQVAIPANLLSYCKEGYTTANSVLDMIVGGCTVTLLGQAIAPTQPDTEDPMVPQAGVGPSYTLHTDSTLAVSSCTDARNRTVDLTDCLKDAAYSSYMKFASGRVIIK